MFLGGRFAIGFFFGGAKGGCMLQQVEISLTFSHTDSHLDSACLINKSHPCPGALSPHHGDSHPLGSGLCGLKLALSFACSEVLASLLVFLGLYSFSDMLDSTNSFLQGCCDVEIKW